MKSSNKRLVQAVTITSVAVLLAACGGSGGGSSSTNDATSPAPAAQPTTFNWCASNTGTYTGTDGALKAFGEGISENLGVWNAAGASAYSICANNTLDANNNLTDVEMVWNVTPKDPTQPNQVIMYPNLMFGWQVGYNSPTATTILPAQVSNLPSLPVTGTITTTCDAGSTCTYDTSFDIFFSNTATPTTWPPQAEVMIFFSQAGRGAPGTDLGSVTIDGITFEVYQGTGNSGTAQVPNPTPWPILTYVPKTPVTNLSGMNIKDFTPDILNRGVINTSMYLDMVELGSEVNGGSGTTSIKNYTIQ